MALKGVRVVEMLGLAPGPFCGMLLADFGATVTMVDKMEPTAVNVLSNGKRSMALDLKDHRAVRVVRDLCRASDVIIEPFRPGVMEKLGLGPEVLMADNPRLIYARLTGYGQSGPMRNRAGHDINYVAMSGLLSMLTNRPGGNPTPPVNYAADFAGGGLTCALGIVMALFERTRSDRGQIIDCNMVEGTAYVSSWLYRSQSLPLVWGAPPGENFLDGGAHFYKTYRTKDGKHIAVGAIEPQFYRKMLEHSSAPLADSDQLSDFKSQSETLEKLFLTRDRDEWAEVFRDVDACVTPVLDLEEAPQHEHNAARGSFVKAFDGQMVPNPAPLLTRTPASSKSTVAPPNHGEHTIETLVALKYSRAEIDKLYSDGVIYTPPKSHL